MPDLAANLVAASGERELIEALGRWLEGALQGRGYSWSGRQQALERADGPRREMMNFYSSHKNSQSGSIRFMLQSLEVNDSRLLEWRLSNPELTIERPSSAEGIVCYTVFNELGRTPANWWLDFGNAERRLILANSLMDAIRDMALPWFKESVFSAGSFESVSDRLIVKSAVDLMEYSFLVGGASGAARFLDRVYGVVDMHAFEEGAQMASIGQKPNWKSGQAIGWSSKILGLI